MTTSSYRICARATSSTAAAALVVLMVSVPTAAAQEKAAPAQTESTTSETAGSTETAATPDTAPADPQPEAEPKSLTVGSWGGAYTEAQRRALFRPFKEATGIDIAVETHGGPDQVLQRLSRANEVPWDVVDLAPNAVEQGCSDGTLEVLDPGALTPAADGTPAIADFLPGAVQTCGVASVAWSAAVIYHARTFAKRKPATLKDLFDVKRFPGKRALPATAKYTLELALMADGVDPYYVYRMLETEAGVTRALGVLDKIKAHIVWWRRGDEPLRLLSDKKAAMAVAFSGRIFAAMVGENRPFGIIWDGQIYDLDVWAVPKASKHKTAAMKFVAFATRPDRLAAQTEWFPYGPMRKSALGLIGKHAEVGVDMARYIPTMPKNFASALRLDGTWWAKHGDALETRFADWRRAAEEAAKKAKKPPKKTKKRPRR